MSRQIRVQYPGAIYHVFTRGIEKRDVFLGRDDYLRFIESLVHAIDFAQIEVWCYAFRKSGTATFLLAKGILR